MIRLSCRIWPEIGRLWSYKTSSSKSELKNIQNKKTDMLSSKCKSKSFFFISVSLDRLKGLIIGFVSIHANHDLMTDLMTHAKHRQELETPRRLAFLSFVDAKK